MNVHWISAKGAERQTTKDLPGLLKRDDGFVWVDIPACDETAAGVLRDAFNFHPLAVQDCKIRTLLPKVHPYLGHMLIILHAPELSEPGRVHLLELDQFVGQQYLVTVHGPLGEGVALETALVETSAVLRRIESGNYCPRSPAELSYSIVSALTRRMEAEVAAVATRIAALERRVMGSKRANPEHLLEAMFTLRHELITVRTIAANSHEVYLRISALAPRLLPPEDRVYMADLADQFHRLRSIADGEQAFLQGVIDFYQTRTVTKLNVAMERLTLLTAILLPVTAVSSIYGMNIIVNEQTQAGHVAGVLMGMSAIMGLVFVWARRQGWW
jgi:magnesium transporter